MTARPQAIAATLRALEVDRVAREVIEALSAAEIASILLKGASFARWLYSDGAVRPYGDVDLLVPPSSWDNATKQLLELGFVPESHSMPADFERHFEREGDGAVIDLHVSLPLVEVAPSVLWSLLYPAHTEDLSLGGREAKMLDVPGRCMHAAIHALQHSEMPDKSLTDLERAIEIEDLQTWKEAARLAAALESEIPFAAGLRLTTRGRDLADRLGLPPSEGITTALRKAGSPPLAIGIERLRTAGSVRRAVAQLMRTTFPPLDQMRRTYPLETKTLAGLCRVYIRRLLFLIRKAPAASLAWHRARKTSDRTSSSS